MASYCMSDIHGEYGKYMQMLNKIVFSDSDTLYILGDVIDRGADGIRILQDMMHHPNIVPLVGNHEYATLSCLRVMDKVVLGERASGTWSLVKQNILSWKLNGGTPTITAYWQLSQKEQREIIEYLGEFITYREVAAGGQNYVLVHGGLDHFARTRPLSDYGLHELIFRSPDYGKVYFPDRYLVTGHTPTQFISENRAPGRIYHANNHIAIDCGASFGGNLGAICLDTGEEFYV